MTLLHPPETHKTGKLDPKPPHAMFRDFVDIERVAATLPANIINSVSNGQLIALAMYLNDQYGCCTISAVGNTLRIDSKGTKVLANQDIENGYEAVTAKEGAAFSPGPPPVNDNGCNEIDVLDYWVNPGIGGDKLVAHAGVDFKNETEIRTALYLTGPLYPGWQLSTDQQSQQVWQPGKAAPGSWGGHAAPISDYYTEIPAGLIIGGYTIPTDVYRRILAIATWGALKPADGDYVDFACDELHALITDAWIAANQDNPAVNMTALTAYIKTLQPES